MHFRKFIIISSILLLSACNVTAIGVLGAMVISSKNSSVNHPQQAKLCEEVDNKQKTSNPKETQNSELADCSSD